MLLPLVTVEEREPVSDTMWFRKFGLWIRVNTRIITHGVYNTSSSETFRININTVYEGKDKITMYYAMKACNGNRDKMPTSLTYLLTYLRS
jgi:hypothetical protein